jgi:hypothetical protein
MTDPIIEMPGRRPDRPRPAARPGLRACARTRRRAADARSSGDVLTTSPLFIGVRP